MKKLLNIIIAIIIRFQSYYFKPEDKFSKVLEIEKLFMKTAILSTISTNASKFRSSGITK